MNNKKQYIEVFDKKGEDLNNALRNNVYIMGEMLQESADKLATGDLSDEEHESEHNKLDGLGIDVKKKVTFTMCCGGCSTGDADIEVTLDKDNSPVKTEMILRHRGKEVKHELEGNLAEYYENLAEAYCQ